MHTNMPHVCEEVEVKRELSTIQIIPDRWWSGGGPDLWGKFEGRIINARIILQSVTVNYKMLKKADSECRYK